MLPKDYELLVEGYEEERNEFIKLLRLSVFHIISPHTDNSFNFTTFSNIWPIGKEKDEKAIMLSDEELYNLLNRKR